MKKDKNKEPAQSQTNYYDLKQEAVDELVDVLKTESIDTPEVKVPKSEDKNIPNPYKLDKLSRVPTWIKVFLIKFWIGGAICYFFFWGLGIYITNMIDLVVLVGLATGLITAVFVNNAFIYFESDKKEYHPYMIIPVKGFKIWAVIINMLIGLVEVITIYLIYTEINMHLVEIKGLAPGSTPLEVEPLLYGLMYLIIDMLLISIKNLAVSIYKNASYRVENKNQEE